MEYLKKRKSTSSASNGLSSAITTDSDTAALCEALEDGRDLESDLDLESGDGIDGSAVIDGVAVDSGRSIDCEAPSTVNLLNASADISEEGALAAVSALAVKDKVPLEADGLHAIDVGEGPAERTPGCITPASERRGAGALGDGARPVDLEIDNRLAVADDGPEGLADADEGVDVDAETLRAGIHKGGRGDRNNVRLGVDAGNLDNTDVVVVGSKDNTGKKNKRKNQIEDMVKEKRKD